MPKHLRDIFIIITNLNVGGAETHLLRVLPHLNTEGRSIIVYTTQQKGTMALLMEAAGIKVIAPSIPKWLKKLGRLGKWISYFISCVTLTTFLIYYRPRIVHFFLPGAYILGACCALLTRRPSLIMSRRCLNYYQKKYPLLSRIEYWLHKRMTIVTGNSQAIIGQLLEEGVRKEQTLLIYNGIDSNTPDYSFKKNILRARFGISEESLVIIIVANLHSYKGHEELLQALGKAKNKLRIPWQLLCLGRDTGRQKTLAILAEQQGIGEHVHWMGEQSNVAEFLAVSDIGIICSHHEGFSNSLLEGMYAELPMIVTDVGGNPEAVIQGETGLIIPVFDIDALSNAILYLSENSLLRSKMGKAAKERIQQVFPLTRCIEGYRKLYDRLLENPP